MQGISKQNFHSILLSVISDLFKQLCCLKKIPHCCLPIVKCKNKHFYKRKFEIKSLFFLQCIKQLHFDFFCYYSQLTLLQKISTSVGNGSPDPKLALQDNRAESPTFLYKILLLQLTKTSTCAGISSATKNLYIEFANIH